MENDNTIQIASINCTKKVMIMIYTDTYTSFLYRWIAEMVLVGSLFGLLAMPSWGQSPQPFKQEVASAKTTLQQIYNADITHRVRETSVLNKVVAVDLTQVSIREALLTVAGKADLTLSYDTQLLVLNKRLTYHNKNVSILEALWRILRDTDLRFAVSADGQLIVMKQAEPPSLELAQETITGTVTDAQTGETLPGVNILVKGTSTGASTNAQGGYELTVESLQDTLVVSFVGYQTQEVPISGRTTIDIEMNQQTLQGQEMVVVGYQEKQRGDITGAISDIQGESLTETSENNITQALQGKTAGVVINDRGGEPGNNNADFFIRGKGTFGNNSPLFVIDGIPRSKEEFANLASNDIESISVLKDASAAIYGARAANGVILVTTKKGTAGKPKVSVRSDYALQTLANYPDLMNAYQRAKYFNEFYQYQGRDPLWSEEALQHFKNGDMPLQYPDTDWKKASIANSAPQTHHNISVSGGTENTQYYFSGDYQYQQGMLKSGDLKYKQAQLRARINTQITDNLSAGINVDGSQSKNPKPVRSLGVWSDIIQSYPWLVDRWPDGKIGPGMNTGSSPTTDIESDISGFSEHNRYVFNTKLTVIYDMPWITDGLQLQGYANFNYTKSYRKDFNNAWTGYTYDPSTETYTAVDSYNYGALNSLTLDESNRFLNQHLYHLQLNYDRSYGNHQISGFAAFEKSENNMNFLSAYRRDLPSSKKVQLFTGAELQKDNDGYGDVGGRINYFGDVSYNYAGRYMVNFSLRYDGSFNFPSGERFGLFPAISAGWNIANESFMDNEWLDNLKLRLSWGKMGNDLVPSFQYLNQYNLEGYYTFGQSPQGRKMFTPVNIANPNITWEKAYKSNIGVDMSIYNGLLSMTLDAFSNKRRDILIARNASVPDYTGLSLPDENIGKVNNKGIELTLNHRKSISDLSYQFGGNVTYHKSKIVYMDEAEDIPSYQKQEGYPLDSWLLYEADGLFRTQSELNNYPHIPGTQPGDIRYRDVNGDGEIGEGDKVRLYSSPIPRISYGLNLGIDYKSIGLNVFFQGQAKAKQFTMYPTDTHSSEIYFTERWTPDNKQNSTFPRAYQKQNEINGVNSTFWLYNAAFLRLKNVRLSYSLPVDLTSNLGISQLEVYLNGRNLITWDQMPGGWDPERPEGSSSRFYYPQVSKFVVGLNLLF